MNEIDNIINHALYNLRDGTASQTDYMQLSQYLKAILYKKRYIYLLAERDSDEERQECARDLIQSFYSEVLIPKITIIKKRAMLDSSFINYTIDRIRKKRDPQARLFLKIRERMKELGYSPVRPSSNVYASNQWSAEKRNQAIAVYDEISKIDLPYVLYKKYKEDSKKADEIIANADLDNLINLTFQKIELPLDIRDLTQYIAQHIEGFFSTPAPEDEDRPIMEIDIREVIKKISPEFDPDEQKCLYNWLVRELTLEEEAKEKGCSHQTISNRREKLGDKLANLLKEHHFSGEDQEIFGKIFIQELEKALDSSFKDNKD